MRRRICLVLTLATCLATPALEACGPWGIGVLFWMPHQPGPARDGFLAGQLGILDSELAPAYHYVAYRHLAGLETGEENLQVLASLWPATATEAAENPVDVWRQARRHVPALGPLGWLSRTRQVVIEDGESRYTSHFLNCLDDAFLTAARTLIARVERFGPTSREARAWVDAQDGVFANCNDGESIPKPLDASWDPLLRADRAYQIAAAHFYATRYAQAAELFRAIARDPGSPWRQLSAYLVARALIRDGRHREASEHLRGVLADPELASMHEPARRLLGYSALRDDPAGRRRELAERLLAPKLEAPLRQDLADYLWLVHQSAAGDDLGPWLAAMTGRPVNGGRPSDVAARRWRRLPEPAWLVAALIAADPVSADSSLAGNEALLAAAAEVPNDSPGHLTLAYHRARLLAGLGRVGDARDVLDPLLDRGDLSAGDRLRLRLLRAEVTPELDDYLRLAAVVPAGLGWDDGSGELLPMGGRPGFPYYRAGEALLPDSAVELLNHGLTTAELLELAQGDVLPEPWRRRLALVTWTRAVITGDDTTALAAAALAGTLAPELEAEMTAYAAADPLGRVFEAAWTLLRFPGLSPVLRWNVGRRTPIAEIDSLRDNGWCADALRAEALPDQIVRSPEQFANLQADLPESPAWPDFVGHVVLAHAEYFADDPRLPEALHRVVRATRIGCPLGSYGEVSKAAFQLLHRRFPSSEWAKQTPYWFD